MNRLPTCQHCGQTWTYVGTMKALGKVGMSNFVICPSCGERNFLQKLSKKMFVVNMLIIAVMLFGIPRLPVATGWKLATIPVIFIGYFLCYPFILRLGKTEAETVK